MPLPKMKWAKAAWKVQRSKLCHWWPVCQVSCSIYAARTLSSPLWFQKGLLPVNCFLWSGSTGLNWRVGPLLCHTGGSQWSLSNTRAQGALGPPQLITSMAEKEPISLLPTAVIYSKLKLTDKISPKVTLNTQYHPILSPTQAPRCPG